LRVALLAGGSGGAKMAHGFQQAVEPGDLTVIVNVADDLEPRGLHVSPDVDSVLYTLAGIVDRERGWGIAGDTESAHAMFGRYGAETWFRVGDADLATHVHRSSLMADGASLTDATAAMADALGIPSRVLPATDDRLRTLLETDEGPMDFQTYFVARRHEPEVRALRLDGEESARPSAAVMEVLGAADLIVIAPSNPLASIGPILALTPVREAVAAGADHAVAISPIIAGRALKGPADRMLAQLGHEPTAVGVARLYAGLVDRFVIDEADAALAPAVEALGMAAVVLPTVMRSDADRATLARAVIARMLPA
jgi:LPPG:FO 2-phospho-L-lactate transferase